MYLIIFQCISFATDGWENRGNCLQNSRKIFVSSFPFPNTRDFIIEMQKHFQIKQIFALSNNYTIRKRVTNQKKKGEFIIKVKLFNQTMRDHKII